MFIRIALHARCIAQRPLYLHGWAFHLCGIARELLPDHHQHHSHGRISH